MTLRDKVRHNDDLKTEIRIEIKNYANLDAYDMGNNDKTIPVLVSSLKDKPDASDRFYLIV